VADVLNLGNREPFGSLGPEVIGQRGTASEPYAVDELRNLLADELDTGDGEVRALGFGPDEIRDIAIVTGSGVDWLGEAADAGVDALVTGEGKQKAFHEAREAGLNVVMAGHYATETFGVQSLQSLVEEGAWRRRFSTARRGCRIGFGRSPLGQKCAATFSQTAER